jgi:MOSC domain-containing protein YiiM
MVSERGVVLAIHLLKVHGQPPVPVEESRAVVGHGLEGDIHGKGRPDTYRQVLIADRRTLEALNLPRGALREQLTVDFAGLDSLPRGTHLHIGEAVLELTAPCEPCETIGKLNRVSDPLTLRDALQGQRGMLARVVAVQGDGYIRRGDEVVMVEAAPARS